MVSWTATAPIMTMIGASVKMTGSASAGRKSSLPIILKASATLWKMPCGPTRLGPWRSCMKARARRSKTMLASAATKTTMYATTTQATRRPMSMTRSQSIYRSIPPSTRSMLPEIATASAILLPLRSLGKSCRLQKQGSRNLSRYG